MKKVLSSIGLCVFVIGMLVLPTAHRLQLSHPAGRDSFSACAHCHEGQEGAPQNNDHPNDRSPDRHSHDTSDCPICKLAQTPLSVVVSAISLTVSALIGTSLPVVPKQPDFTTPRLIPYSCGPPA